MKLSLIAIIALLGCASAMKITAYERFPEFAPENQSAAKDWIITFGKGFVDGVTFNYTEGTDSKCKTEITHIGDIFTHLQSLWNKIISGNFDFIDIITTTQDIMQTWWGIVADCQFAKLWANIAAYSNPLTIVWKILTYHLWQIPKMIKIQWNFTMALFKWNAYSMGYWFGEGLSNFFKWEIY